MRWSRCLVFALFLSGCFDKPAADTPNFRATEAAETTARPMDVPVASAVAPATIVEAAPAGVEAGMGPRGVEGGLSARGVEIVTADPASVPPPPPARDARKLDLAIAARIGDVGSGARGSGASGYGVGSGGEGYRARIAPAAQLPALRAGTTDDNADFNAYLTFLAAWSDRASTPRGYRHIDVRDRTYIRLVDAAGHPVPNAKLRLRDPADQNPAWEATTLGDGRAVYYPRVAGRTGLPTVVEVDHRGLHAEGVLVPGQDLTLTLARDVAATAVVPLDVLFLIDTTGSMDDEIARIKETLMATTAKVRGLDRKVELRYGAVLYRDKGDDYVTREIPFTADVRSFQGAVMAVQAGGGGDTPEHLDAGLSQAINLQSWRGDAAKLVFLIADAPPHLDYGDDVHYADSIRSAVARGIRVHAVAASGLDPFGSLVFRQIAQYTGGKFIFIEYGGSIAASAAAHGVTGQVNANNLDDILFREIKTEVLGFGI